MNKLRIAQVMASGPVSGGLEKHFGELCAGLASQHDVMVIAHPAHAERCGQGVAFSPLDSTASRRNPLLLFRLQRLLAKFRPDVIHAHANKAAAMVHSLRRTLPARRVATVHGFKRHNEVFQSFDEVIAVSRAISEQLPVAARVIPNGIRPPELSTHVGPAWLRQEFGFHNRQPVVVAVGRLAPVKGFDFLLESWRNVEAQLLIVGDGPERQRLEHAAQNAGLQSRVRFAGYRRDVPDLLASSDLAVITSQREGFPYVLVEALHLKRPVASTRFPGAEQIIPPPYLCDYGDSASLARIVHGALTDPEAAQLAFQSSWQQATQEFTVERMLERTLDVYQQLPARAA